MSHPPNPLLLLAQVACEAQHFPLLTPRSPPPSPLDSLASPYPRSSSSMTCFFAERLHIPCTTSKSMRSPRPLAYSTSSNNMPSAEPNFVPYVVRPKKKSRKTAMDISARMQMKAKRQDLLDKANRIKSLENSPVNERQLSVLRMIYDEITMYPCESWMVLVAIIINRAYKQVKNWFSNERQKNRYGDSVPTETEEGDKVRLRPSALAIRPEWSDAFFEEVTMIHNYKVQRNSQSNLSIRRSSRTSDQ